MKHILTLFICLGTLGSAFAQTSSEEARRVILGKKKTDGGSNSDKEVVLGGKNRTDKRTYPNYPSGSSREQQIDQVNREYDAKIQSVRNNPYLSQAEKDRAIRDLNADRERRIRAINRSFDSNRDERDGDDDNDYNDKKMKKSKGNNGNHYGWEKGKGNPHKNGGQPGNKGKKKN